MKPIHQTLFGDKRGNCLQAAVASVLELSLDEVPNFSDWYKYTDWAKWIDEWTVPRGFYMIDVPVSTFISEDGELYKPHGYHLLNGKSPRGDFYHVIVCKDGKKIHDPYPEGDCELATEETWVLFVSTMENGK